MPNSSPLRPRRPKSTLDLFIPFTDVAIPIQEALEDSTRYDHLLRTLRDATPHTRKRLSVAIELADIMETARTVLNNIRATLDEPSRVDPWSPNKYDSNKLMDPGSDLTDPDCFFSKHATPRARVLFRITAKEIYYRAKRLNDLDRLKLCSLFDAEDSFDPENYHTEIIAWIGRFVKMLEVGKTDGPFGQIGPRNAGSRKRKQGLQHAVYWRKCCVTNTPSQCQPPIQTKIETGIFSSNNSA